MPATCPLLRPSLYSVGPGCGHHHDIRITAHTCQELVWVHQSEAVGHMCMPGCVSVMRCAGVVGVLQQQLRGDVACCGTQACGEADSLCSSSP
jgi:hypothetical protein